MENLMQRFLEKTDETGRFMVYSNKTGIKYFVEPIMGGERRPWGDLIPGKSGAGIEGDYGSKYLGAVHKEDSLITEENGFKNIELLGRGVSPHGTIEETDNERYAQGFRPRA